MRHHRSGDGSCKENHTTVFHFQSRNVPVSLKDLICVCLLGRIGTPPMSQRVTNPPAMQETQKTWVLSLGQEDPLEEGMATHSSSLVWGIPGQRSLVCYGPKGFKELDKTEATWHAVSVYMSTLIFQFVSPSPSPLCPHICSLCLRVYSCLANYLIHTIFPDSLHLH